MCCGGAQLGAVCHHLARVELARVEVAHVEVARVEVQQSLRPYITWPLPPPLQEVEEIRAFLAGRGGFGPKVVAYHAKMPLGQRSAAHAAFMRDDVEVCAAHAWLCCAGTSAGCAPACAVHCKI